MRALVQLHREVLGHVPGDVEGIHRGGQTGDQEDGAAGEEDDEMSHNEPLPSDDAGESVNNDHTYCVLCPKIIIQTNTKQDVFTCK